MTSASGGYAKPIFLGLIGQGLIVACAVIYVGTKKPASVTDHRDSLPKVKTGLPLQDQGEPTFKTDLIGKSVERDYVYGARTADVSLISYVDLQCSFCAKFDPIANQLVESSNGKINLAVRLYPLQAGGTGEALANIAECVGSLHGDVAFYRVVSRIFEAGQVIGSIDAYMAPIFSSIDVKPEPVMTCAQERRFAEKIKASVAEANAAGVAGTPTSIAYSRASDRSVVIMGMRDLSGLQKELGALPVPNENTASRAGR